MILIIVTVYSHFCVTPHVFLYYSNNNNLNTVDTALVAEG